LSDGAIRFYPDLFERGYVCSSGRTDFAARKVGASCDQLLQVKLCGEILENRMLGVVYATAATDALLFL
jgi:hypothetical protein